MNAAIRRHFLMNLRLPPKWKERNQVGGAILHEGHPIQIHESINGDTIVILGGRTIESDMRRQRPQWSLDVEENDYVRPCFILELKGHTAVLQSIEKGADCFADGWDNSRALVTLAARLAQQRGATILRISDRSSIECPEHIPLADLSFLTTGRTWYESALPGLVPSNPAYRAILEKYRQNVMITSWGTVSAGLRYLGYSVTVPGVSPETSAMSVLSQIKKSGQFCAFFSKMIGKISAIFDVPSLFAWDWELQLQQPSQRRRTTQKRSRTRTPVT